MSLAEELRRTIRGEVEDAPEVLERYSRDASLFVVRPEVVVHPRDREDVATLVRFARREKSKGRNISVTPRSAGTDMSGGPLGNSIIVDVSTHLNHLLELRGRYATVEPGMYFRDFD